MQVERRRFPTDVNRENDFQTGRWTTYRKCGAAKERRGTRSAGLCRLRPPTASRPLAYPSDRLFSRRDDMSFPPLRSYPFTPRQGTAGGGAHDTDDYKHDVCETRSTRCPRDTFDVGAVFVIIFCLRMRLVRFVRLAVCTRMSYERVGTCTGCVWNGRRRWQCGAFGRTTRRPRDFTRRPKRGFCQCVFRTSSLVLRRGV